MQNQLETCYQGSFSDSRVCVSDVQSDVNESEERSEYTQCCQSSGLNKKNLKLQFYMFIFIYFNAFIKKQKIKIYIFAFKIDST